MSSLLCLPDSTNVYKPFKEARNTFAFWAIASLLFILAVGNLILTSIIVGTLRLACEIQFIELLGSDNSIKFYGIADLDRIYKRDGIIENYANMPMSIVTDESSISINILQRNGHNHNSMVIDQKGIQVKGIERFEMKNHETDKNMFTTSRPHYNIPKSMENLNTKVLGTSRVVSPTESSLSFKSNKNIKMQGSEGIHINAQKFLLSSEKQILLKSLNSSIILKSGKSFYLNGPKTVLGLNEEMQSERYQYKICVCMPQGKIFRVLIPRNHTYRGICTQQIEACD